MARRRIQGEGDSLSASVAALVQTLDEWQAVLAAFQERLNQKDSPMDGDAMEAAWQPIATVHHAVEAEFGLLAELVEDHVDLIDALAARQEAGEPVSWDALKAELGLS